MNDEILQDIHRQVSELNRKTPNIPWRLIKCVGPILLLGMLAVSVRLLYSVVSDLWEKPADSWDAVVRLADRADLADAYDMALRLERKAPTDWRAAYRKGEILVQMQKMDLALSEFKRAYQVLPNERLKERIDEVTKALTAFEAEREAHKATRDETKKD